MFSRFVFLAVAGLIAFFTLAGPLSAATSLYWDPTATGGSTSGGGAGTWNTASWWNGTSDAAWVSGDNAIFGGSIAGNTVTLSAGITAANLTFNTTGYTISPNTQTLTLSGGVVTMNNNATATIVSTVAGGGVSLTVSGSGNLALTPKTVESISGTTYISNGGTLTLNSANSGGTGVLASSVFTNINSGGVLAVTGYNGIANGSGAGNFINVNPGGLLNGVGNQTCSGFIYLNGGTLASGSGQQLEVESENYIEATANSTIAANSNYIWLQESGGTYSSINVANGATLTYLAPLTNGGNTSYLTKTGGGSLVFNGAANSYTGNTLVGAGTLSFQGAATIASTPLIGVGQGATLDVSGLSSTFTLGAAQTLVAGRIATWPTAASPVAGTDINGNISSSGTIYSVGTLTVNGSVTLTGGALAPSLSSAAVGNIVTPALTLTNTTTINPAFISNGSFPVITSTAPIAGGGTMTLGTPPGGLANWRGGLTASSSMNIGTNAVTVTYSGLTPASLTWSPTSSNPYAWNVNSTYNWTNSGTGDVFYHGDAVTFPANTSGTVSIASNVYPSSITFSNSNTFYITGAGAISGPASIVKNGAGTVVFGGNNTNNNNTFWGGTTINSGQVWLGSNVTGGNALTENPSALGTGPITINGSAQLDLYPGSTKENFYISNAITFNGGSIIESDGHQYLEGPLTVSGGGGTVYAAFGGGYNSFSSGNKYVEVDGAISGSGNLYFSYAGYGTQANFFIDSPNPNYTGTVTFNTTTYDYLLSANAFPNATVNVSGEIGFFTTTANFGALEGNGAVPLTTTANSPTPGVAVTLTAGSLGSSTVFSGALSGAGGLVLTPGSTLTLTGNSGYSGTTTINPGAVLSIGNGSTEGALNTTTVSVPSGAALLFNGASGTPYNMSAAVSLNGGYVWEQSGLQNLTGAMTVNASGGTLLGSNYQELVVSGALNGSGPLLLAATNSYAQFGFNGASPNYSGALTVGNGDGQAVTLNIGAAVSCGSLSGDSMSSLVLTSTSGAPGTLTIKGGNNTYPGQISGAGGLTLPSPAVLTITNQDSANGTTTLSGGTLIVGAGGSLYSTTSTFNITGGALNLGGVAATVGNVNMNGGLITGSPGSLNASSTANSLNVTGTGVATLDVPATLAGNAMISSGTLALTTNGAVSVAGSMTIVPGGVWDVSAFGSGGYNFGPGGALVAGRTSSFNTDVNGSLNINSAVLSAGSNSQMTISGNLGMSNGTLAYATGGTVALINGGALSFTGMDVVSPLTALSSGTYALFTYSSLTGGSAAALADLTTGGPYGTPGGQHFSFQATGSSLSLIVKGSLGNVIWNGGSNQTWDVGTSPNWFNPDISGLDNFYNGESVLFNDSPGTATTVNINDAVYPGGVTVSNTNESYTFINSSGTGTILGNGSLVKNGPGLLTLSETNGYTGTTAINGGTLAIGVTNALPVTTAVTMGTAGSNGVLDLYGNSQQIYSLSTGSGAVAANQVVGNSQGSTATLVVSGGTSTFGGIIQDTLGGSGGQTMLNVANGAKLTLTGSNTFTGTTTVDSISTLQIGNGGSGASLASPYVSGGGKLVFDHSDSVTYGGQISGIAVVHQGAGTLDLSGNLSDNYPYNGSLAQQGGTLLVTQGNSYSGGTVISGGTVQLGAYYALAFGNLTMSGGELSSSSSDASYTLPNNLTLSGSVSLGDPVNNGALEFSGTTNTLAGNTHLTVNSPVTVDNGIGGGYGLTINGGSLTLDAQCTYSGTTTVNSGGTLQLNYAGAGAGGGTLISPVIVVNAGGFLALTSSNTNGVLGYYNGRSALVIDDGVVANNGAVNVRETLENPLTMTGGTLTGASTGDGHGVYSLNPENGATAVVATSDPAGNPAVINAASIGLQAANVIFNVTRGPANPPADLIIDSNIQQFNNGTGANTFTLQGNGILALAGSNVISKGVLDANGGTLALEPGSQTTVLGIGNIGGGSSAVNLSAGAMLYVGSGGISVPSNATAFNLNGGTLGAYQAWSSSAAMTIGGALTVNNGGGANGITLSGNLGGVGSLTEVGTGNLTLSGTNTYSGGTVVNYGALYAHNDLALGAVPSSFQPANITLNGGLLRDNSNAAATGGADLNVSANRGITLGPAGGALRAGWSNITTVNGVVSGTGPLTIANDGQGFNPPSQVYLANVANTYTGTTTIGGGALPSNFNYEGISTLTVAHLANGGQNSSIGASSNAASNLVFNVLNPSFTSSAGTGTLNYAGAGDSTDRLFTVESGQFINIDNIGTGPLNFTNTGAIALTGTQALTLTLGGTYAGATPNTFAPVITDNSPSLLTTLAVNGSFWTLSGTNTYTGGTTVTGGELLVTNSDWVDPTGAGTNLSVGNELNLFGGVVPAGESSPVGVAAAAPAVAPVPEPGTLALAAALLAGAAVYRRRYSSRSARCTKQSPRAV